MTATRGEPDATPLLERGEARQAVEETLAEARHGDGQLLLIEGAPGIGKSRLLAELRHRGERRQRVLAARAGELEQAFPFGVVRQLFEAVARDPELAPRIASGPAAAAAAVLGDADGADAQDGAAAAAFATLHALHWLVLNLAEEAPLVLAVDDLHWCDVSSLRFLVYLARRIQRTPVLLAATLRSGAPAADALLLADLVEDPATRRVVLRPLSRAAVGEIVGGRLGGVPDAAFAGACHEATEGNPLLLRQLLRSLEADRVAPSAANAPAVRDVAHRALARTVLVRLERMPPDARAVARAVAVLGEAATVPLVAQLARLDDERVARAASVLVEGEILRRDVSLAFVHALVRDVVYHELPEADRQLRHARAARLLDAAGAPPERVASQVLLAPPRGDAWAADVAAAAARAASHRGAQDAAAGYLRRALAEPAPEAARAALTHALAEALVQVDGAAAAPALREAHALASDPAVRAQLALGLARTLIFTGPPQEALLVLRRELQRLGEEGDPELRNALSAVDSIVVFFGGASPDALAALRPLRAGLAGTGQGSRMLAGVTALAWMYDGGSASECGALAAWAVAADGGVRVADEPLLASTALYVLALADRDEGIATWEDAQAEAHRAGSLLQQAAIDLWLGFTRYRRGDVAGGVEAMGAMFETMRNWGFGPTTLPFNAGLLVPALLDRGELAAARTLLPRFAPAQGDCSLGALLWLRAHAELLLAEGAVREALAVADDLAARADWMRTPIGVEAHGVRARALVRADRREDAQRSADAALVLAEGWGAPSAVGAALRLAAELRPGDAGELLERAVAVLEASPARLELARALAAYGAWLRRDRRPSVAREPLAWALELAESCGAAPLEEEVRIELAAAGVRRAAGEAHGAGALTPSERRVAERAAAGETNRAIAQQLFVTPKTVEVHLSNAYRKLGIASRRELPAALPG